MGRKKARRTAANATIRLVANAGSTVTDTRGPTTPSETDIAMLAYHKWMARGRPLNDAARDWFDAQDELRQQVEQSGRLMRAVHS